MSQLIALQNMADASRAYIVIHVKSEQDKRRKVPKYFATISATSISPVLDYTGMNLFLLGYLKARARGEG
jgi:ABC-type transporter MlaC component